MKYLVNVSREFQLTLLLLTIMTLLSACVIEDDLPEENLIPEECTMDYEPVCSQGQEYVNKCLAKEAGAVDLRLGKCPLVKVEEVVEEKCPLVGISAPLCDDGQTLQAVQDDAGCVVAVVCVEK